VFCLQNIFRSLHLTSKKNLKPFIGLYDQVIKSIRRMPWQLKAMKDVVTCDKLRGASKQALIRRFPNGKTQYA
jgi:hypothetical protein